MFACCDDVITKHGICEAYYERYISLAKTELLAGTGLYESDDDMPIPLCMLQRSFQEALEMEDNNNPSVFWRDVVCMVSKGISGIVIILQRLIRRGMVRSVRSDGIVL